MTAPRHEDGWTVRVRWLPWTPPWRLGKSNDWTEALKVPIRQAGANSLIHLPVALLVVLAVVVLFLLGVLLTAVTLVLTLIGIGASVASHLVLRRPFLVEASNDTGDWAGWWVSGWRRARRVRDEVDASLRAGENVAGIDPDHATRVA